MRSRSKRRVTGVEAGIALIVCLLLGGCGAGADCGRLARALDMCSTQPVIKIGLVAPFEGRYRSLGYEALGAVKQALRERNAAGGVSGYMVELVALNDGHDSESRRFLARKFAVDERVMGVIGPFSDDSLYAAASSYQEQDLPLITPVTCAPSGLPGSAFCLGASTEILARALARAVPADARVVVLQMARDDSEEGGRAPTWVDDLPGGGWEIRSLEDWRAVPADCYLYEGDVLTAAELLIEMRGSGVRTPLIGGPMLARTQLSLIGGDAVEGVCHVLTAPLYVEEAGEPGRDAPWAALAYDASVLLLDALQTNIETSRQPTREGVAAALEQARGPDGELVFEDHLRRQVEMTFYCYQAGDTYPGSVVLGR
jgi:ABC-type branched-subunit amino acid transport system substrate-binding protein